VRDNPQLGGINRDYSPEMWFLAKLPETKLRGFKMAQTAIFAKYLREMAQDFSEQAGCLKVI
jgi:hypothetical protein